MTNGAKGDTGDEFNTDHCQWFDPQDIEIHSNPRTLTNPGFKPEKMKELREGIRKDGLKQALEIRLVDGKPRLIAGERRLRNILNLVENDAECYNRRTRKWEKASKVYKKVPCVVTHCESDKDATRAAVLENLLHEHLTDYELLLACEQAEAGGMTRAEQADLFGKSEAWVSQSHSLLKGDPLVLEAMASGILGRTQALRFLNVAADKVKAVLERSIKYHEMEEKQKEKELLVERDRVYESLEAHDAELAAAMATGNKEAVAEARQAIAGDEAAATAVERRIKKHKTNTGGKRTPRPSINHIDQAAKDEDADNGPSRHMPMKTVKRIADQLTTLLDKGEALVNKGTEKEYSRREVRIIRDVLDCILSRNTLNNPLEALDTTEGDEFTAPAEPQTPPSEAA